MLLSDHVGFPLTSFLNQLRVHEATRARSRQTTFGTMQMPSAGWQLRARCLGYLWEIGVKIRSVPQYRHCAVVARPMLDLYRGLKSTTIMRRALATTSTEG